MLYLSNRQRLVVKALSNQITGSIAAIAPSNTNLKSEQGRSKRMQGCNLDGDDAPKIICHLHRLNWYDLK